MPKLVKEYVQHPPYAIQIELTEGCNLRCGFCGLNGIRAKDNNLKFLTTNQARIIASKIKRAGWNPRIEFAMHGEPSLNPQMVQILVEFRHELPSQHMMMTSNGGGFMKDPNRLIDAVLENVNVLALDDYENVNIVPKILEAYKGKHEPHFYPVEKEFNPHLRRPRDVHHLVIVQDIKEATTGTHSTLNNHSGCGAPKNPSADGKRCAKPFREMSIRWDGNVAVCCNDWRGYYKCGNVIHEDIVDIWRGEAFQAARKKLYHGMRDFGPCAGCDALSYRPGLLPDPTGQASLPEPGKADLAAIEQALAGDPYTVPVSRPWELQQIDSQATTATQDKGQAAGRPRVPVAACDGHSEPQGTRLQGGIPIKPQLRG